MMGSSECEVKAGVIAQPLIKVGRVASRVVLRSITCNVARQYEKMIVDCVYLGNASIEYSLEGESLSWANVGGYADAMKNKPIGLSGEMGSCPAYLYRSVGCEVMVGQRYEQPVCLYCYPNGTSDYTYLYLLTTIGDRKYYYRVPLDKGLESNRSSGVDVVITNLGADSPVDGDIQKGEIKATISIEDWLMGYQYDAEF